MKHLARAISTLGLLAAFLAACGPPDPPADTGQVSDPLPPAAATATLPAAGSDPTPTLAATSRGSQLVASDPAGIVLGSGRPALVEFFRFT